MVTKRVWNVEFENEIHTIELEHSYFSGKRVIYIDGKKIFEDRKLLNPRDNYYFQLKKHNCVVSIKAKLVTFDYDFIVDNISLKTGKQVNLSLQITKEKEEWKKVKEKGRFKFILFDGILNNGFVKGSLFGIFLHLFTEGLNISSPSYYYDLFIRLIIGIIVFSIQGYILANSKWNRIFKKQLLYQNPIIK